MAKKKRVPIARIFGTTEDQCRETKKNDVNFVVEIGEYTFPMHALALFKAVKEVENAHNKTSSEKDASEREPSVPPSG